MVIDALFGVNPADRRQEMYSPCITLPPQNSYTYSRQRSTASLYCLSCILYLLHSLFQPSLSFSLSLSQPLLLSLSLSLVVSESLSHEHAFSLFHNYSCKLQSTQSSFSLPVSFPHTFPPPSVSHHSKRLICPMSCALSTLIKKVLSVPIREPFD